MGRRRQEGEELPYTQDSSCARLSAKSLAWVPPFCLPVLPGRLCIYPALEVRNNSGHDLSKEVSDGSRRKTHICPTPKLVLFLFYHGASICSLQMWMVGAWLGKGQTVESFPKKEWELPRWSSGEESARQCREHRFDPWSGKIPHTAGQLSPWATTTEPVHPRAHASQRRKPPKLRSSPSSSQLEEVHTQHRKPSAAKRKKEKKKREWRRTVSGGRKYPACSACWLCVCTCPYRKHIYSHTALRGRIQGLCSTGEGIEALGGCFAQNHTARHGGGGIKWLKNWKPNLRPLWYFPVLLHFWNTCADSKTVMFSWYYFFIY